MVIKRVGVLSLAKVLGVMYAGIGLIFGGILALMAVIGAGVGSAAGDEAAWSALFGVGAIVVLPFLYGILGFVGGLVCAGIFNLTTGFVGGLEIDIE